LFVQLYVVTRLTVIDDAITTVSYPTVCPAGVGGRIGVIDSIIALLSIIQLAVSAVSWL
jgi:hypothetical protein